MGHDMSVVLWEYRDGSLNNVNIYSFNYVIQYPLYMGIVFISPRSQ